ncbi:MAG: histidinol-phosphate transaminase [Myxococcota bacterium]
MTTDDVPEISPEEAVRAVAEAARTELGGTTLVGPEIVTLPPIAPDSPFWADVVAKHGDSSLLMGANENPLGPSPQAVEAMQAALPCLHRFPDPMARGLKEAIAAHHGVTVDHIVVGHGANELIERLVRTFVGPLETVVTGWPSYAVYRIVVHAAQREMLLAPLRDDRHDLSAMAALVGTRTKLVFIANPNNPTGTYVSHKHLVAFLERIPRSVIVVLDEAYAEFADAPDFPDSLELLRLRPRLVVLRSFSKTYGLAGLRVGYGLMDPELVPYLDRVRQAHNLSAVAQAGALAAIRDRAHMATSQRIVREGLKRLDAGLRALDLEPILSQTNFLIVRLPRNAEALVAALSERGAFVRRLAGYDMPDTLRITAGKPGDNERLLEHLDELRHVWR